MDLLVIFDSNNQDTSLGVEINRMMEESGWTGSDQFSFAYTKEVDGDYNDIESGIKNEVREAVVQAEWKNVKYLYAIGDEKPQFDIADKAQ